MSWKTTALYVGIGVAIGYLMYATLIQNVPVLGGYYKSVQNSGAA